MTADARSLIVFYEREAVGVLESNNDIWSFEYTPGWLDRPGNFALSPAIALSPGKQVDGSTTRHIQWFFDNLLPEEAARRLMARDARLDKEDSFGLLVHYGSESAGALTLLPPDTPWPEGGAEALSSEALSARIKNLPRAPLIKEAKKKMSLAGAQHKLPVIYHNRQLLEPVGAMPSSHILKPEHEDAGEYWSTVCNEWFSMQLARKLKLPVAQTHLIHVPEPVYIVKRFDRLGEYPHQRRRHVIDACQILGLYAGAKYRQSHADSLIDLLNHVNTKAKTRIALLRWVVFNALIGNGDAHLKNLSFYALKNGYQMTEHYDLLSTIIYNASDPLGSELSQPVGEATVFKELTRKDINAFGRQIGLPEKLVDKEVNALKTAVVPMFDVLYEQVEGWRARPSKPGDLRMLREIKFKVLLEMLKRV